MAKRAYQQRLPFPCVCTNSDCFFYASIPPATTFSTRVSQQRPRPLIYKYGNIFALIFFLASVARRCHSDPATAGEESASVPPSIAETEILRFAQDDRIGDLPQDLTTIEICHRVYETLY